MTAKFPQEERFGLTLQMRKAVVSVASNIAEGSGHSSKKDFARFLEISISSSCELETQLILSFDINYINGKELKEGNDSVVEIQKMLDGLIKSLA